MRTVSEATAAEQRRIIDELLTRGVAGITVSVIDPAYSRDLLNRAAAQAVLFTSDIDAAGTDRMLYVGTDNVAAGEQAGELIKAALPDGGDIMLFVGTMGAANAQERVQGIRNVLEGGNVNIIDVRTNEVDFTRAKRNVEDTLTRIRTSTHSSACGPTIPRRSSRRCGRPARWARSRPSASTWTR